MQTWNAFYGNDIVIGLLGAAGFLSMIAVVYTASKRTGKRELILREARRALKDEKAQKEIDDALGYDNYSK